jgi:hypothetical protein
LSDRQLTYFEIRIALEGDKMQIVQSGKWSMLALSALVCLGCAEIEEDPVFPVSGTVTRKGSPVEGVAVTFVPEGSSPSAVGVTDASGKYMLTTRAKDDGATAGKYKVTFAKYEGKPSTGSTEVHADYDISNEYPAGYNPDAQVDTPSKNLLPVKYALPESSGYTADVVEGENTFDFDLKD